MSYLESLNPACDVVLSKALSLGRSNRFREAFDILKYKSDLETEFIKALCLLNLGKKDLAYSLFQKVSQNSNGNFLAPIFCDMISGTSAETTKMYGSEEFAEHFQAAAKSNVFGGVYLAATNTILDLLKSKKSLNILDIGIGSAFQIKGLIRALEDHYIQIENINILGIEPFEVMKQKAIETLDEIKLGSKYNVQYELLGMRAQELVVDDVQRSLLKGKVDFANACLSIHHMPMEDKKKFLQNLCQIKPEHFILSDADSDHESIHNPLSFELVSNVHSVYSCTLKYMMEGKPDNDVAQHYRGFCYANARDIIAGTKDGRIEYHTCVENWIVYLKEAGFAIIEPQSSWRNGIPEKHSKICDDYLTTTYCDRPITFQLVLMNGLECEFYEYI